MEFKDLVSLYFQQTSAMQTLWDFYISVILALLGYFGATKSTGQMRLIAVVLSTAFVAFAGFNCDAIREVLQQRLAVKYLIDSGHFQGSPDATTVRSLQTTITPPSLHRVVVMHIMSDAVTLGGIWYLVLRKRRVQGTKSATRIDLE
jgi:hypothetical protein